MATLAGQTYPRDTGEMLDALPERVVRYRLPDLTVVYCNVTWAAWHGLTPAQVLGRSLDEFLSDDGRAGLASQLARLGPDNPILADPTFRADLNSPGHWVEWVDHHVSGPDGAEVIAVGRDVTERHIAELKLKESEARFRDLADKSADVVWHFAMDPHPHFDYVSPSVEHSLGYPVAFFLDDFTRFLDILDDRGRSVVERGLRGELIPERRDFRFRHADGSIVIGETLTTRVRGGLQGVSRDVTELRELQEAMTALALRDPLTGLANRRLFAELLDAELARAERSGLPLAVAFLDLNGFKRINDTYGHDAGDAVLCETARRLLSIVRGTDVVARLGGDEFVVVYEPTDPISKNLTERIDRALSEPIDITPTIKVWCPASIGTADTVTSGRNATALLAAADRAMYRTKRALVAEGSQRASTYVLGGRMHPDRRRAGTQIGDVSRPSRRRTS
jgi:diguanylate cyclase (GGDEF)-like protein/PAS domain S-box-containing protein